MLNNAEISYQDNVSATESYINTQKCTLLSISLYQSIILKQFVTVQP